ncbi:Gdt1 family transmembrane protein [Skeletonema marinoi]|uniref:GDT1 family protein n=1 Tax=Skeletonema marinoi TaxID=267567 RepID=A0A6U3UH36_9STRA|nr:Gdt1 family transmembrane protein [Skeletonema marinoi]|mmetsp:Transcript_6460/g.9509  ORF Transcript_6460/g.9509 Transcript_6460/m.9509 type:complete len:340 (+) Transcript_6460:113-1132(+)
MKTFKVLGLVSAGICVQVANGFVGSPLTATRASAPSIRGPLAAKSIQFNDNVIDDEVHHPEVIIDDGIQVRETSHMRNAIAIVAPSVAMMTIAAFALPTVSNAIAVADISSIAGGASASASAWIDSLTDSGFYQAFSLVFLSEIGDKTFFVAALLAAKLSRFISFVGSLGALAVMTVISVIIGQVFHAVPAGIANGIPLDDVAAVLAFTYFGIKILSEAFEDNDGEKSAMDEEFEEAEETVEGNDAIMNASAGAQIASIFALVFAAEFGDRSFLATIALSAAQNPVSVAAGGIAAHGVATGIAVIGGAYISKYVSEKVIGIIGGSLFLIFAVTTAVGIF